MLFPGDAKFLRTDTGRAGDRVYRLEFSNGRRMFFWMQEPKAETDEEHVSKLNECIDNPPAAGAADSSPGAGASGLPDGIPPELMQALMGGSGGGGDSAQALQALLGGAGGGGGGGGGGGLSEDDEMARAIAMSMQDLGGGDEDGTTTTGGDNANADGEQSQGGDNANPATTPAPAAAGGRTRAPGGPEGPLVLPSPNLGGSAD